MVYFAGTQSFLKKKEKENLTFLTYKQNQIDFSMLHVI